MPRDNHEPVETPINLAAVQADDTFLDEPGSAGTASGDTDAELAMRLLAWKGRVEDEPMPELVSTDDALAHIKARKEWLSKPLLLRLILSGIYKLQKLLKWLIRRR